MGGVAAHYASWRDAQWLLAAMGFFAVVPIALWLPETLDPEKLQRVKDEGKLLDFDYTNEDVESLRQQMQLPGHVSSPLSEGSPGKYLGRLLLGCNPNTLDTYIHLLLFQYQNPRHHLQSTFSHPIPL